MQPTSFSRLDATRRALPATLAALPLLLVLLVMAGTSLGGCGGIGGSPTDDDLNPVFCGAPVNGCTSGSRSIDLDGDACADRCETPSCETFAPVVCADGASPIDADGDGCARECPGPTGATCGGLLGLGCDGGAYCDFPLATSCGSGDQTGTCQIAPEVCADIYAPVCACDGTTYANECEAHAVGVSVAHWGACSPIACPAIAFLCTTDTHAADTDGDGCLDGCVPNGGSCGGLTPTGSPTCAATEYCAYQPGDLCGAADASSTCMKRPDVCTDDVAPVCGCNGKTYSNACVANAYGTGILHLGACDVVCPAFYPDCAPGYEPSDGNGDGCLDGCSAVP